MQFTLRCPQKKLIKALLASSLLLCNVTYINSAHAVLTPIGVATTAGAGNAGFDFAVNNGTLTVPDTIAIGDTLNVSIDNTALVTNTTVLFQGSSAVSGSIGNTTPINTIIIQGVAGKLLNVVGNVNANNLTVGATALGDVTLDADLTIHNNINVNNPTTVFKALNIYFVDDAIANFSGDLTTTLGGAFNLSQNAISNVAGVLTVATDVNMANSAQLTVNGKADITGDINAVNSTSVTFNGEGNVNNISLVNDAMVNFNAQGKAGGSIGLSNSSAVNFKDNYDIVGDLIFQLGSTASVSIAKNAQIDIGGALTTIAGSKLNFDFGNTFTPGKLNATGNANILGTELVTVTNVGASDIPAGTTVAVSIIHGVGGVGGIPTLSAPNNIFMTYSLTQTGATDINFSATRLKPATSEGELAAILAGVDNTNASGELLDLFDNLANITDPNAQRAELAEIAPLIDGGIAAIAMNAQDNTFDLFSQRINELRAGLDIFNTGYAAGHMDDKGHGTWVKILGAHVNQNKRNNIEGYRSDTWGVAAGLDTLVTERNLVGVAFTWASADVNHDLNSGGTDINSYQGSLYGSWNISTPLFLNWMASVALNKYDATRKTIVGNFNQTTLAEFDGWQYGVRGELGYILGEENFHIIPNIAVAYSHLTFDAYREKGNSTANQFVDYRSVNALLGAAGISLAYDYETEKSLLTPEIHTNVSYDFIGDKQKANARFVNFGPSYQTQGATVARWDYNVGLSLTTYGDSGLGVSISYDYDWKHDYRAHSGFIRLRYEW